MKPVRIIVFCLAVVLVCGGGAALAETAAPEPAGATSTSYTSFETGETLEKPGNFDIGIGEAVALDTRKSDDDDSHGLMLSIKAYPFGRWYSTVDPSADSTKKANYSRLHKAKYGKDNEFNFFRRFSVWYGVSLQGFDGGGIDGTVHALGIGLDISPEFAVNAGYAIYDVLEKDAATGDDKKGTDGGLIVGVSLNLNSFTALRNAITNFNSPPAN